MPNYDLHGPLPRAGDTTTVAVGRCLLAVTTQGVVETRLLLDQGTEAPSSEADGVSDGGAPGRFGLLFQMASPPPLLPSEGGGGLGGSAALVPPPREVKANFVGLAPLPQRPGEFVFALEYSNQIMLTALPRSPSRCGGVCVRGCVCVCVRVCRIGDQDGP